MLQGPVALLRRWAHVAAICAVLAPAGAVPTRAQPAAPPGVEVVDVPLVAWVAARPHALPDTLMTFAVGNTRLRRFRQLVSALADQDWNRARERADVLDYQLVAIREGGAWFVVASDGSMTGRDPTIVINVSAAKDVIVTAPHVPFETGTGEQAVTLLRELGGLPSFPGRIAAPAEVSRRVTASPPCAARTRPTATPIRGTMSGHCFMPPM
jgi:hypothetical protein